LKGFPERAVLPTSPGLAYLQETGSALASPIAPHTPISPTHSTETKGDAEDVDRISVASVSSAGVAGVGAGAKTTAPGPRSRPSSIVVPEQVRAFLLRCRTELICRQDRGTGKRGVRQIITSRG
jgi:hypothetical protein